MSYIDLDLVEPGLAISGSLQAITVDEQPASVGKGLSVNCAVEAIAAFDLDASVSAPRVVDALAASILSESLVSSVLTEVLDSFVDLDFIEPVPRVVDAATESIAVQANTASLSAARTVACAVEAISVTAGQASIGAGLSVSASAASVLSESLVSAVLTAVLDSFVDLEFPDPVPLEVNAATEAIAVQSGVASLATIRNVDCAVESISVSAAAASISAGRSIAASVSSVLAESLVSSVLTEILDSFIDISTIDPRVVDAVAEAISVTANPATIGAGLSVSASAASVLAESLVSAVLTEILDSYIDLVTIEPRVVDAATESISVAAHPATIGAGLSVSAGTALVVSESLVAAVLTEILDSFVDLDLAPPDSLTVEAHAAAIGVSGQAATVQTLRLVECSTESVGVSSGVASVGRGRAPMLSLVGVSVDAEQASVVLSRAVDAGAESVSVTALGAEIGIARNVDCSTASATVYAFPATVSGGGIETSSAVISIEAYRADLSFGNTPPAQRRVRPQPRRRVARIAARRVSRH